MITIKSEKGNSLIEFVLVLPLLLILTFAIIEFGILLFDKAVITNAAREGARAAIVANYSYNEDGHAYYDPMEYDPFDPNVIGVVDVVLNYTSDYLISFGVPTAPTIYVCWDDKSDPTTGDVEYFVEVTVEYNYNFIVLPNLLRLIGGSFDDGIPLEGITRMRMELAQTDYAYDSTYCPPST